MYAADSDSISLWIPGEPKSIIYIWDFESWKVTRTTKKVGKYMANV